MSHNIIIKTLCYFLHEQNCSGISKYEKSTCWIIVYAVSPNVQNLVRCTSLPIKPAVGVEEVNERRMAAARKKCI
jgi:hypothetical protein